MYCCWNMLNLPNPYTDNGTFLKLLHRQFDSMMMERMS